MITIKEKIFHIYTRSLNLNERFNFHNNYKNEFSPSDFKVKFKDWKKIAFDNNEEFFENRIKDLNKNSNEISKYFSKFHYSENIDYPEWVGFLEKIIKNFPAAENELQLFKNRLVPFQEIYNPIVKSLVGFIVERISPYKIKITENGIHDLELGLYNFCRNHFGQTIFFEYKIFKSRFDNPITKILEKSKNYSSDEIYNLFISQFTQEQFLSILLEYPLLAKLIAISFSNIVENLIESIVRLNSDINEIEEIFEINTDEIKIERIEPSLSDFHNGGKSVISFTLTSGTKLIYKPRSLDTDKLYYKILDFLENEKVIFPQFEPKMLIREHYGWIEKIEQEACNDKSEVNEYYENAGSLLAIIYILGGNDFHFENVIAKGKHPVLIDLETIIHPPYINVEENNYEDGLEKLRNDISFSVLRSGLIPSWATFRGKINIDISALGFYEPQQTPYDTPKYTNEGSDNIGVEYTKYHITEKFNVAYLQKQKAIPFNFINEIKHGFEKVYNYFMQNNCKEIVDIIGSNKIRYIYRSTNDYGFVMRQLLNPKFLRDGVYHSFLIDRLFPNKKFVDEKNYLTYLKIFEAEQEQLSRFDVPYFYMKADGKNFHFDNKHLENLVSQSAVEVIQNRILKLSEDDKKLQLQIISRSLNYREFNRDFNYNDKIPKATLENSQFENELKRIAEKLINDSVEGPNDTVNWLIAEFAEDQHKPFVSANNLILYTGLSGIGIFFSSMYFHFKDEKYKKISSKILAQFEQILLNKNLSYMYESIPNGIGVGIGSIIYSLVTMAEFLDSEKAIELAENFAEKIEDERISRDSGFDLLSGNSGLIIAFEKLYKLTKKQIYLDQADKCVNHLIQSSKLIDGLKLIPTVEGKVLTGFSHGAAGIAYALLRINHFLNKPEIKFLAEEHLKFERKHFNADEKNWPDFREKIDEVKFGFMTAWCHGSAGIGYSRLALKNFCDDEVLDKEILDAVENSKNYKLIGSDHVCCGNFSVIEFLNEAGNQYNNKELIDEAKIRASELVLRAQKYEDYIYFTQSSMRIINPSFFQGISGIGYSLLKIVNPKIKSVLMFE